MTSVSCKIRFLYFDLLFLTEAAPAAPHGEAWAVLPRDAVSASARLRPGPRCAPGTGPSRHSLFCPRRRPTPAACAGSRTAGVTHDTRRVGCCYNTPDGSFSCLSGFHGAHKRFFFSKTCFRGFARTFNDIVVTFLLLNDRTKCILGCYRSNVTADIQMPTSAPSKADADRAPF